MQEEEARGPWVQAGGGPPTPLSCGGPVAAGRRTSCVHISQLCHQEVLPFALSALPAAWEPVRSEGGCRERQLGTDRSPGDLGSLTPTPSSAPALRSAVHMWPCSRRQCDWLWRFPGTLGGVCEPLLLGGGLTQHCPCPPHSQASGGLPQSPLAAVALPAGLLPQQGQVNSQVSTGTAQNKHPGAVNLSRLERVLPLLA